MQKMKMLCLLLICGSLCSCSSSVEVETSGLVINETKGEFSLNGKEISEEEAEEYIIKNSKSDKIVVVVEDNEIGVYTVNEIDEFMSAIFETFIIPHNQSPLSTNWPSIKPSNFK